MTTMERIRRFGLALATAATLAGGLLASGATSAFADYGQGAQYQIEISENCNGLQSCDLAQGNGVWLWIELNADGTGDYEGADCAHGVPTPTGVISGAFHDSGDVTWTSDGQTITITGVTLLGTLPLTVTVPAAYGHYSESTDSVLPGFPVPGLAQVQVAP